MWSSLEIPGGSTGFLLSYISGEVGRAEKKEGTVGGLNPF